MTLINSGPATPSHAPKRNPISRQSNNALKFASSNASSTHNLNSCLDDNPEVLKKILFVNKFLGLETAPNILVVETPSHVSSIDNLMVPSKD